MTNTIAIGDIHGLNYWEEIVEDHADSRIVFLGDYLDPYEYLSHEKLLSNLQKIIELKKAQPHRIILLYGNHDLHYFNKNAIIGSRFNWHIESHASRMFRENTSLFQNAYQEGNIVFTHAGISQEWFERDFKGDASKPIAEQLNNPTEQQTASLHRVGWHRGGRRGDLGGIFWADAAELDNPLHGFTQVVGHNRVKDITVKEGAHDNKIIFCDCLRNNKYMVL